MHIYARALANFAGDAGVKRSTWAGKPLGLRQQICYFLDLLGGYVGSVRGEGSAGGGRTEGGREVRVILVGHSVGAYIALEVLRRLQRKEEGMGVRVVGVLGLWPTVTHIAKSPSGVRIGVSSVVYSFLRFSA